MLIETFCGFAVILLILYKQKSVLCYFMKFLIHTTMNMVISLLVIPLMIFFPMDYDNLLLISWCQRQISKIIGIKWEIRGQNNLITNEGSVVLVNHQSLLDTCAFGQLVPLIPGSSVIMKREIFYMWPLGLALWLGGIIFINRLNKDESKGIIDKLVTKISRDKAKICICPEGTRHGGDGLLPFKKGAFHLAINSQAPIQPVVVSKYSFLDHKTRTFTSGNVVLSILPPIKTAGLTLDDLDELVNTTYDIMSKEFESLNSRST